MSDEPLNLKRFAVVRPYPSSIRRRVFKFLEEQGYAPSGTIEVGTPDATASRWVESQVMDLLLLPFHKHKATDGNWVNGLGVAQLLGAEFFERGTPILMPVDEFTFAASFERELSAAVETCPQLETRLVIMREREIGAEPIIRKIGSITTAA